MHEPIRDNLEDYLRGSAQKIPPQFQAHLDSCAECAGELRELELQAQLLRSLRPNREIEPSAGFYARVMNRIESQRETSIWSILLEPAFGRRLAVACATLVVLLGTYFVATELGEPMVAVAPGIAQTSPAADANIPASFPTGRQDSLRQERQRDAVLVNLASFHE